MMKKFVYLVVAALAFTACSKDDVTSVSKDPVAAEISAGVDILSRALDEQWEADEIGVMATGAEGTTEGYSSMMAGMYKNVKYTTTASTAAAASFSSDNGIYFQDDKETVTFAAYGPYQESSDISVLPGEDGVISSISTELQSTRDAQKAFDFIYASGATASKSRPTVEFQNDYAFAHKMTRLVIVIKPGDDVDAEEVLGGTYSLGGLLHSGTFNVSTGEAQAGGADAVAEWSLSENSLLTEGETEQLTFTSILYPQTLAEALTFTAVINNQSYTNKTAINPALESGTSYSYTITVKNTGLAISGCTVTNWGIGGTGSGDAIMQ